MAERQPSPPAGKRREAAVAVHSQVRPVDERELSRVLAEASAARTPLEVTGAGSKQRIGRPLQTAAGVSSKAMRGITLYEPSEMVMAARAGTPLSQVETALAERGQMLAFEPIDYGPMTGGEAGQATIGGVFAANVSGARRVSIGAARDHLLGIRAVNGRGEVFKSGGRVMKNVTGYDLCRGLAGSWGTLAVLTEVTFKVLPAPEETGTLLLFGLPDDMAVEALCTAMASPFEVSGAVHVQAPLAARLEHSGLRSQGAAVTALRIENFSKSVAYRTERLKALLKAYGTIMELEPRATLQFWGELRRLSMLQRGEAPVWRISTQPTAGPKVVAALSAIMEARAFYDWSGGLVWAEVLPTADAGAADVRRVIASFGGHATLIRAEPQVRAAVDVFQPLEAGLDKLSRRLKAAFDPAGILNPGRMYAGM
jgi:glycolate oxidase FAD binding subunit